MKFKPKCVHRNENGGATGIAYNNRGFLLPCCWADGQQNYKDFEDFYNEDLNLENSTPEEIITSDVWVDFYYNILNEIDIPNVCKEMCMNSHDSDPYRNHVFLEDDKFIRKR